MKRGKWFFRASVCESIDTYSIMLSLWNIYARDTLHIRFFSSNEEAALFVNDCVSGKFGDTLEQTKD